MKYLAPYFMLCLCVSSANSYSSFPNPNIFIRSFESLIDQFWIGNHSVSNFTKMASIRRELFQRELGMIWSNTEIKCFGDIRYILQHLDSKSPLQMLDASGKIPSGTFFGNGLWMGNYQECQDVVIPANEKELPMDIHGMYCVATWNVSVPSQFQMPLHHLPIKTGICIPSSCYSTDIGQDLEQIRNFLDKLPFFHAYENLLNLTSLNCHETTSSLSQPAMLFIYFLGMYFVFIVIGSSITVIEHVYSRAESGNKVIFKCSSDASTLEKREELIFQQEPTVGLADNHFLLKTSTTEENFGAKRAFTIQRFQSIKKFLKCFCVFSNASEVLDTKSYTKQFSCIHGIRFLSMAWVILGHTYIHNINIIGNVMELLHSIDNLPFQIVTQGTFSVDSFFLISGFLLAYLFLEESDNRNGKINLIGLVLHRFLRITPVYMILLAFNTFIFEHTGSGPFWNDDSDTQQCKKYWWWHLLYINNFLPLNSMCVTWTWYLASDMQFFVFGIIVLYILWRSQVIGLAIICTTQAVSWIITGCLTYKYNLIPLFYGLSSAVDYDSYRQRLFLTWDLIYTKPYCRIGPYLVGILLAYYMHENRKQDKHMKLRYQVLGWCCASFCSLSAIYGIYHQELTPAFLVFYNALARTSFSIGVAWVIFCCLAGKGELVNRILSFKVWIPLSRMTYCAYLFHPLLMSWYFDSQKTPLYFTHTNRIMLYFGFLVVSYVTAFFVSIIFESPIVNLEKIILKKNV